MKKYLYKSYKIFLSIAIVLSVVIAPYNPEAKSASTLRELRDELSKLQSQKKANETEKANSKSEIKNKTAAINTAYSEIEIASGKIEVAKQKIAESEVEIEKVSAETKELITFMQIMSGENAYTEYVSGAGSVTDMIMRLSAIDQITDYNREQLERLESLIKENEQLKIDMANYQKQLNDNISAYENRINKLDQRLAELDELADSIDDQIKNQKALIDYYVGLGCKEDQNLQECVSIANNSGWLKPLKKGYVSSLYGYRKHPTTGVYKLHNGIDLAGNNEGTPVYAAASGTVAAITRKSSCGGNKVYVHVYVNGVAYTTYYFHLLSINVKVGDKVNTDTVIGTVGGGPQTRSYDKCSTGAHLHLGVAKGFYLGGGKDGYSSYSTLVSKSMTPPGFGGKGWHFYSRTQFYNS